MNKEININFIIKIIMLNITNNSTSKSNLSHISKLKPNNSTLSIPQPFSTFKSNQPHNKNNRCGCGYQQQYFQCKKNVAAFMQIVEKQISCILKQHHQETQHLKHQIKILRATASGQVQNVSEFNDIESHKKSKNIKNPHNNEVRARTSTKSQVQHVINPNIFYETNQTLAPLINLLNNSKQQPHKANSKSINQNTINSNKYKRSASSLFATTQNNIKQKQQEIDEFTNCDLSEIHVLSNYSNNFTNRYHTKNTTNTSKMNQTKNQNNINDRNNKSTYKQALVERCHNIIEKHQDSILQKQYKTVNIRPYNKEEQNVQSTVNPCSIVNQNTIKLNKVEPQNKNRQNEFESEQFEMKRKLTQNRRQKRISKNLIEDVDNIKDMLHHMRSNMNKNNKNTCLGQGEDIEKKQVILITPELFSKNCQNKGKSLDNSILKTNNRPELKNIT